MIWYKNTIIEVTQHHFDMFRGFKDVVGFAMMCHFRRGADCFFFDEKIKIVMPNKEIVSIDSELIVTDKPFKFIIAENEDDYWGTCTAKNLPCDGVPVQQPVAH